MKKVLFEGEEFLVMDETSLFYICEPQGFNEGYAYISKSNAKEVEVKTA